MEKLMSVSLTFFKNYKWISFYEDLLIQYIENWKLKYLSFLKNIFLI